jgi:hypothetical protein
MNQGNQVKESVLCSLENRQNSPRPLAIPYRHPSGPFQRRFAPSEPWALRPSEGRHPRLLLKTKRDGRALKERRGWRTKSAMTVVGLQWATIFEALNRTKYGFKKAVAFLKKRWDAHPGSAKNFCNFYTGCWSAPGQKLTKVFCFFFSKKKIFLLLDCPCS